MVATSKKDSSIMLSAVLAGAVLSALVGTNGVESFSPSSRTGPTSISRCPNPKSLIAQARTQHPSSFTIHGRCAGSNINGNGNVNTFLSAKASGEGGKKKRRRRKRKKEVPVETAAAAVAPPAAAAAAAVAATTSTTEPVVAADPATATANTDATATATADAPKKSPAYQGKSINDFIETAPVPAEEGAQFDQEPEDDTPVEQVDGSIPLPDIKDMLRKKKMEAQNQGPTDDYMPKEKIDRKDRKALLKLLEQDPYADGDDSFFEAQEYTAISAWLGEGTRPFLGIPTGPLQVGHTIGALVIVLMAFIEYPGFPLTNLPTPLRGALQGGLGTIYGLNVLLAVVAGFKASARGQPLWIWIPKTLTVGALALDQLTQLPTTEQKNQKGKRALKNRRK